MYLFIVNKASGNGRGNSIWNQLKKLLKEKDVNYIVQFTEHPTHATEIAKSIDTELIKTVVIVGGDGTVHEVVNGLKGLDVAFSVIPAGSGNDFARAIKMTNNYKLALERILAGERKKIDIVRIGDRSCITVVGIGFDGKVAEVTNQSKHKKWLNQLRLGKFTYVLSFIQVLFKYRPTTITLKIDEKVVSFNKVWLIAVGNFPYYGGGMLVCPEANSNDGLLDLCVVQDVSRFQLLRIFPKVFRGTHVNHPAIRCYKAKNIEVICDDPLVVHGDGEIIGQTPIKVTVQKDAFHVV